MNRLKSGGILIYSLLIVSTIFGHLSECSVPNSSNDGLNKLQANEVRVGNTVQMGEANMFGSNLEIKATAAPCPPGQKRTKRGKCVVIVHK